MDSKERLKIVVNDINKTNSLTNEELSTALRYKAKNYVSDIIGGAKPITDFFLERLQREFNVNPEYIISGADPTYFESKNKEDNDLVTIAEEPEMPYFKTRLKKKNSHSHHLTPVFNTRASAGHAIFFDDRPELIAEYVDIPFIGKSDGVIEIVGSSMSPTYVNGTRIAVRKLEDKQLIYPNECYYIIDANYDGRVKRLIRSQDKDCIILRSDNKDYPDVDMPWEKIVSVCKILCRIIKS